MNQRPEYDARQTGRNLRRLRLMRGYTAEQIREYIGVGTVQTIYKWERGDSFPSIDNFFALVELYGVEPLDILSRDCQEPSCWLDWERMEERRICHIEQYWIRLQEIGKG